MVKNTTGGTKTKGLARKHQQRNDEKLRLPCDALEEVACVTKMFGNGMCEIYTEQNERLIGHIRNKFRGRQKRHNMISTSTVVLIGLREWENPIKNCDILTIYSDSQISQLKNMPNISMNNVMRLRNELSHVGITVDDDEFDFTNMVDEEEEDAQNTMKHEEIFSLGDMGNVDVDDI
jgi:initiation factor 1A